jgi:hypothetical protein
VTAVAVLAFVVQQQKKKRVLREQEKAKVAREKLEQVTRPAPDDIVNTTFLAHQRKASITNHAICLSELFDRAFPPRQPKQIPLQERSSSALETLAPQVERKHYVRPMEERTFDVFLNHAHESAQDQCSTLCAKLEKAGLRVWYDMQASDLTAQGMEEGVSDSRNVLMFLSDNLMSRPFCQTEQRWGKLYGCSFIGVVEQDPRHSPADFTKEKDHAPDDLKHLLDEIEFICYRRKDFEQEAMIKELVYRAKKSDNILGDVNDCGQLVRQRSRNLRNSEGECVAGLGAPVATADDMKSTNPEENVKKLEKTLSQRHLTRSLTVQDLIKEIRNSRVLVLMLSREMMTRPWCLLEIHAALTHGIPIVPIRLEGSTDRWKEDGAPSLPDDKSLRRLCREDESLLEWLDTFPAQPAELVKGYVARLQQRLDHLESDMIGYDAEAPDAVRKAVEDCIVDKVTTAMKPGQRPAPIAFDNLLADKSVQEDQKSGPVSQPGPTVTTRATPDRAVAHQPHDRAEQHVEPPRSGSPPRTPRRARPRSPRARARTPPPR